MNLTFLSKTMKITPTQSDAWGSFTDLNHLTVELGSVFAVHFTGGRVTLITWVEVEVEQDRSWDDSGTTISGI